MTKIIFSMLLVIAQIIPGIFSDEYYRGNVSYDTGTINISAIPFMSNLNDDDSISLNAVSAVVYDIKNNEIVFARNPHKRVAPASLTKLITALTVLEYMPADTIITVGTEIKLINPESSRAYLQVNDKMVLRDLLYGLLLPSGCDVAYTLAVNTIKYIVGESYDYDNETAIELFVSLMNKQARKIGMTSSRFTTPDGFDDDGQYITARDMLILSCNAYNNSIIKETVSHYEKYAKFIGGREVKWESTNLMLNPADFYYYNNIIGMKTGSSEKAGKSFVGVYEDARDSYITVVLGCEEYFIRYIDTGRLIHYAKTH